MAFISAHAIKELTLHLSLMGAKNHEEKETHQSPSMDVDRFRLNAFKSPKKQRTPILESSQDIQTVLKRSVITACDNNQSRDMLPRSDCLFDKTGLTMDEFWELKRQRDLECCKMNQYSQLLKILNDSALYGLWDEKLLTEKLLLQSSETVELLVERIRRDKEDPWGTGTIQAKLSLENFDFQVSAPKTNSTETEFFLLVLNNGYEVKTSKIERATNGTLKFHDKFTFKVKDTTSVRVKIYSIVMKEAPKMYALTSSLMKKTKCYSTTKYQYENILTSKMEEKLMLNSAFRLCAETEITMSNTNKKKYHLHLIPGNSLDYSAKIDTKLEDIAVDIERSGFLTLGMFVKNYLEWNRKWCVLKGSILNIYNAPNDEIPLCTVHIGDCKTPIIIAPRDCCSRTRCLKVEVQEHEQLVRYFLRADDFKELYKWKQELNNVANLLANWKELIN